MDHSNQVKSSNKSKSSKSKWKCGQCTYENWPSALKCTICLSSCNSATSGGNPTAKSIYNSKKKSNSISNSGLGAQTPLYEIELLEKHDNELLDHGPVIKPVINDIYKLASQRNSDEHNGSQSSDTKVCARLFEEFIHPKHLYKHVKHVHFFSGFKV
jgi:hypothetical protein